MGLIRDAEFLLGLAILMLSIIWTYVGYRIFAFSILLGLIMIYDAQRDRSDKNANT